MMENETAEYDVVICGGGLAGLSLARQLHLSGSRASILVLDALGRPLPEAGFKVGESTIETGAFYFYDTLKLRSYLEENHLEKLGLRYFYGGNGDFASRPEYGVAKFLPAKSYQLDRGRLEQHLRTLVEESDVELREGVRVKDIHINSSGPHTVQYIDGEAMKVARTRWVIDAMGRQRYIQRKLGLARRSPGQFNSTWWRVRGRVSVSDFVALSDTRWHGRVRDDRWQSTNHLMGKGYWVWLIPLASEITSIGIVTDESIHPFDSYDSYEKSMAWLRKHEPVVADRLQGGELVDFQKLRNYSYTSTQVFSADRWACVGVSGVFADPYYSVGSNIIGFANGYIQKMLEMDEAGVLTKDYVDFANRYLLALNDFLTDTIHRGYPNHHIGPIMALKTIWDYFVGWTTTDPQFYHETYLDPAASKVLSGLISRVTVAQGRILEMFEEWGERTDTTSYTFDFIDYIEDLPTLKRLHVQNLFPKTKNMRRIFEHVREAVDRIEELAQVIFRIAVSDVLPEKMGILSRHSWLNIEAISLFPDRWEVDGLFRPKTTSRDIGPLTREIECLFRPRTVDLAQPVSA